MKYKVTYYNEFGGLLSDIIECDNLDEVRTTALDEIPGCCEINDITPAEGEED